MTAHLANAISSNPYAVTGALGGGVGGAIAAGEGNRTKGALGGAVLGGLAGKAAQEGIARFGPMNPEDEFEGIRNVPRLIKETRKERIEQIRQGAVDSSSDALEALAAAPFAVKNMAMSTPKTTAAVLGTGLATGAGAGTVIRKRKEKRKKMQKKAMFYEKLAEAKQEKKRKGLSTKQKLGVGVAGAAGLIPGAYAAIKPAHYSHRYYDFLRNKPDLDKLINIKDPDTFIEEAAKYRGKTQRRTAAVVGTGALIGGALSAYGAKKLFDRHNARKQQKD